MIEFSRMNYPNTHKDTFVLNEDVYAKFQGYLFNWYDIYEFIMVVMDE